MMASVERNEVIQNPGRIPRKQMSKTIVIGGGAAGMMAAVHLARGGEQVILFEKNEKLGKKIYITGKGRCNFTNNCDHDTFFSSVVTNPKFMYSSYAAFTAQDAIRFFEDEGLATKCERGNRMFPESDHASDVIRVLRDAIHQAGVEVRLNSEVSAVLTEPDLQVVMRDDSRCEADHIVVATGGLSYATTGSTGDGLRFADENHIATTKTYPSLVGIESDDPDCARMQGLSLKNAKIRITSGRKEVFRDFGEMLFSHYGVSGPMILTASAVLGPRFDKEDLVLHIDLKPALDAEKLRDRFLREADEHPKRGFQNAVSSWFPRAMLPVIIGRSGIDPNVRICDIGAAQRDVFLGLCKDLTFTLRGLRGYKEAVVTKGGVNVRAINPRTMEAKEHKGLYFIGEVLDVDALTGGFNLQIAWSTAVAAARAIIDEDK